MDVNKDKTLKGVRKERHDPSAKEEEETRQVLSVGDRRESLDNSTSSQSSGDFHGWRSGDAESAISDDANPSSEHEDIGQKISLIRSSTQTNQFQRGVKTPEEVKNNQRDRRRRLKGDKKLRKSIDNISLGEGPQTTFIFRQRRTA